MHSKTIFKQNSVHKMYNLKTFTIYNNCSFEVSLVRSKFSFTKNMLYAKTKKIDYSISTTCYSFICKNKKLGQRGLKHFILKVLLDLMWKLMWKPVYVDLIYLF